MFNLGTSKIVCPLTIIVSIYTFLSKPYLDSAQS